MPSYSNVNMSLKKTNNITIRMFIEEKKKRFLYSGKSGGLFLVNIYR